MEWRLLVCPARSCCVLAESKVTSGRGLTLLLPWPPMPQSAACSHLLLSTSQGRALRIILLLQKPCSPKPGWHRLPGALTAPLASCSSHDQVCCRDKPGHATCHVPHWWLARVLCSSQPKQELCTTSFRGPSEEKGAVPSPDHGAGGTWTWFLMEIWQVSMLHFLNTNTVPREKPCFIHCEWGTWCGVWDVVSPRKGPAAGRAVLLPATPPEQQLSSMSPLIARGDTCAVNPLKWTRESSVFSQTFEGMNTVSLVINSRINEMHHLHS